jgi:hypothetical protein
MRKTLLTAVAAPTLLFAGILGNQVGAMPVVMPSALGAASPDAALVRRITNVCGTNGCVRVQTQRVVHHRVPGRSPIPAR